MGHTWQSTTRCTAKGLPRAHTPFIHQDRGQKLVPNPRPCSDKRSAVVCRNAVKSSVHARPSYGLPISPLMSVSAISDVCSLGSVCGPYDVLRDPGRPCTLYRREQNTIPGGVSEETSSEYGSRTGMASGSSMKVVAMDQAPIIKRSPVAFATLRTVMNAQDMVKIRAH